MSELPDYLRPPEPQYVSMSYELGTAGWASLHLKCGETEFTIPDFGSLTDGLGDVVRAALALVTGASHVEVLFDGEPQVWGLVVEPAGLANAEPPPFRVCRMTVKDGGWRLEDAGHSNRPVWQWQSPILFEGHIRSDDFGKAALSMAEAVRAEFNDSTYRERWGHYASLEGFPLRGMIALKAALAIKEFRE